MTRKLNIWNTPLRSPSTEAQDYAEKIHSRRIGRIRPTENRKPPPKKPPETPEKEENTPNLPLSPVEDLPLQQHDSDPLETSVAPQVEPEPYKRSSVLTRRQRRRNAMSIAVSEEEEELLRQGASAEGMTFSGWARKCLFRAMKRKIPDRPDRS